MHLAPQDATCTLVDILTSIWLTKDSGEEGFPEGAIMANPHGRHVQAVGFAGLKVQTAEDAVEPLIERVDVAYLAVLAAVGNEPTNEYAKRALGMIAALRNDLPTLVMMFEDIKQDLNTYANVL